jgi:epsilon-lactone hydrolase
MPSRESQLVSRYWELVKQPPEPDSLITNDTWDVLATEPRGVDYQEGEIAGVPALWVIPHSLPDSPPVLLCFHGGGYVGGSTFTHRKMFAHLAKAVGARALIPEYTLVPNGGTYPHPIVEGVATYRALLDQGIPASRIGFAGDSAGGGLSMTVQLRARSEGLPLPALTMLMSPWNDLEGVGNSLTTNEGRDVYFTKDMISWLAANFLAGHSPSDPDTMPLHADLRGFGPVYIQVGDAELLLDDSRLLAQRLRAAGVEVQLEEFEEQQHSFQMAVGRVPEADRAIADLAAWASPKLAQY